MVFHVLNLRIPLMKSVLGEQLDTAGIEKSKRKENAEPGTQAIGVAYASHLGLPGAAFISVLLVERSDTSGLFFMHNFGCVFVGSVRHTIVI